MSTSLCDGCGERPTTFLVTAVETGDTHGWCPFCFITSAGQLAEALGLTEAPAEEEPAEEEPAEEAPAPEARAGNGRGRKSGGAEPTTATAPPLDQEAAPEPAAAEQG